MRRKVKSSGRTKTKPVPAPFPVRLEAVPAPTVLLIDADNLSHTRLQQIAASRQSDEWLVAFFNIRTAANHRSGLHGLKPDEVVLCDEWKESVDLAILTWAHGTRPAGAYVSRRTITGSEPRFTRRLRRAIAIGEPAWMDPACGNCQCCRTLRRKT